jgi:hypothetical protein
MGSNPKGFSLGSFACAADMPYPLPDAWKTASGAEAGGKFGIFQWPEGHCSLRNEKLLAKNPPSIDFVNRLQFRFL